MKTAIGPGWISTGRCYPDSLQAQITNITYKKEIKKQFRNKRTLRALMMRAAAEGTTSTEACLFLMVSLTVTLRPFQSWVALAMSSPIFLGDRPKGPTLGAKAEVAATSPPTARRHTTYKTYQRTNYWIMNTRLWIPSLTLISLGSNLGGILNYVRVDLRTNKTVDETKRLKKCRWVVDEITSSYFDHKRVAPNDLPRPKLHGKGRSCCCCRKRITRKPPSHGQRNSSRRD